MLSHCLKCRQNAESKISRVVTAKKWKTVPSWKCGKCASKKCCNLNVFIRIFTMIIHTLKES